MKEHSLEEPSEPKDMFVEPDINQVLPARRAAQKATSQIQKIVVEETPSGPSCLSAPNTASAGVQTERMAGPCAATASLQSTTPGREVPSLFSTQPPKSQSNGEMESKVIPGRTNNQVVEMRKKLSVNGYVNCIYEVRCPLSVLRGVIIKGYMYCPPWCVIIKRYCPPWCVIIKGYCPPWCVIIKGYCLPWCVIIKGYCLPWCVMINLHGVL